MIFELSMPNRASWNGRWSGEEKKYTLAKRLTNKCVARLSGYYSYSFGDGWVARVTVREAKKREKATGKFCGYDWMIDKIIAYGEIRP